MNCTGCGVVLDPTQDQVDATVDQVLAASLADAHQHGGVCPLCGHSKQEPRWNRKTVLFALLVSCLLMLGGFTTRLYQWHRTERAGAAKAVLAQMQGRPVVEQLLGAPITAEPEVIGGVTHDESGWEEAQLTLFVRGPKGEAEVHAVGSLVKERWQFTTLDVLLEKQHKKLDLISGRIVSYEPNAYVDIHTEAEKKPVYLREVAPLPKFDRTFPCVFANAEEGTVKASVGRCAMPTSPGGDIDRFEVDLRDGAFVLRQTDLRVNDVFDVPLTRSYRSDDWLGNWGRVNQSHAFGVNSNHPYDIAPQGSRNPYTFQMLVLEDGDFLYFDRISKGTGYADAVYQHTETSSRFYKATTSWNGGGWTTRLADGSSITFPESYNAKNLAQGAAISIRDADGNELKLNRDAQRNLKEILTPHQRRITFDYDDHARVTEAVDDAGDWTRYGYDAAGMLIYAIHSSGHERHYSYEGALMTAIADENAHILLRNFYQRGFLTRQEYGNGDVYAYRYIVSANRMYFEKAVVTMPDRSEQEISVGAAVPAYTKKTN